MSGVNVPALGCWGEQGGVSSLCPRGLRESTLPAFVHSGKPQQGGVCRSREQPARPWMCLKARVRVLPLLATHCHARLPLDPEGSPQGCACTLGPLTIRAGRGCGSPSYLNWTGMKIQGMRSPGLLTSQHGGATSWVGAVAGGRETQAIWIGKGGASRELGGGHREGSVVKGTGLQCPGADTGPEGGCPGGLEREGVGMK